MSQTQTSVFEQEILQGLKANSKYLLSKYFYDDEGSRIFQEIMQMEEYYLPACETEILQRQSSQIIAQIPYQEMDIIELGAGDGSKTVHLLEAFARSGKQVNYLPMDISSDILEVNKKNVHKKLPELEVQAIPGDYFQTLEQIKQRTFPRLILFMGSNIGNFKNDKAIAFIQMVNDHLRVGDFFLMGVDLKKHPRTILAAYDDAAGITKKFNLNLLKRINRELDGNFDLASFDHYSSYDPITGTSSSYLVSLKNQTATILNEPIHFSVNEVIHMEISQKYSLKELDLIANKTGFSWDQHFTDSKGYFSVSLFKK